MHDALLGGLILSLMQLAPASLETGTLIIEAARVNIEPAEQRSRNLPVLEFQLELQPVCREPAVATHLSLSVADVRKRWSGESLKQAIEASLVVPARQIAPLHTDFCSTEDYGKSELIRAVLTAQLALACTAGDSLSIEYLSLPMDVELTCVQPSDSGASDEPASSSEADDTSS